MICYHCLRTYVDQTLTTLAGRNYCQLCFPHARKHNNAYRKAVRHHAQQTRAQNDASQLRLFPLPRHNQNPPTISKPPAA